MAINKNHEFDDLDGVKCAIVEKNVSPERVEFLKNILRYNGYTVVVVPSPPAKVAAPVAPADGAAEVVVPPAPPSTFTLGVSDSTFNPVNAIMGRLLRTPDGHVVTLSYWHQKEKDSHDEIPYYENKA